MADTYSRRDALGAGIALATTGSAASKAFARPSKRPNIVFILADDMGYADLSCFGRRDYVTPALDRLAAEGMRFTSAYSNSPDCSATRVALMTGRYQYRLPVGLAEPLAGPQLGLDPALPTLPSRLREASYSTALIGKWHLGEYPKFGPLQSGYDHFWGFRRAGIDYFSHENLGGHDLWDDDTEIHRTGYSTDLFGNQALVLLEHFAKGRKPFFLSLHFNAPHWPWEGPSDQAESRRISPPTDLAAFAHFDGGTLKTYGEIVRRLDFQVGRVLNALESYGLAHNTIVIFTSDNGGERFSDTWPFSGRKNELLEGGLRVPTILRWPDKVRPGSTTDTPILTMDWMPTLLSAAGIATDSSFVPDGVNIEPLVSGSTIAERALFWRFRTDDQRALRLGRWKYLKIRENEFLFDILADPLERTNLKKREPERFADLVSRWNARNAEMLPMDPAPVGQRFDGAYFPDR